MIQRDIYDFKLDHILQNGNVIEYYADDFPFPSVLYYIKYILY